MNRPRPATRAAARGSGAAADDTLDRSFALGPLALAVLDVAHVVVVANPACARLLGVPLEELVGSPLARFLAGEEATQTLPAVVPSPGAGRTTRTLRLRTRGAAPRPVEATATADPAGGRWYLALRDAPPARHEEEVQGEFIATVSHELRTPLTSIRGALGLVGGEGMGALPPAVRELLALADRNALRLARLVDDILDVEQMSSGRLRLELREVDLLATLRECAAGNEVLGQDRDVALAVEGEAASLPVWGDAMRLRQVLDNLVQNAIRHSPAGGTVRLRGARTDERVRVHVSDEGPGIPEAFRARLFQRFAQAIPPSQGGAGGSGLGLYISRQLVEAHGGAIRFASQRGLGTVFTIELPLRRPGARRRPVAAASLASRSNHGPDLAIHPFQTPEDGPMALAMTIPQVTSSPQAVELDQPSARRVLVLLDGREPALPGIVRRLRRMGCLVRTVASSEALRAELDADSADLVLLPFTDSAARAGALLPWLAEAHRCVPVLLVAQTPSTHQVMYALEVGVVGFVTSGGSDAFAPLVERAQREREVRLASARATWEARCAAEQRRDRSRELDAALAGLEIVWQPLEDARSGIRDTWEALVRAPALGRDGAAPLLHLARELDRAGEVDHAVQQRVAATLAEHPRWRQALVNVEPATLLSGSLAGPQAPLARHAARVVLDLPRFPAEVDPELVLRHVSELRLQGYSIAAYELAPCPDAERSVLELRPELVKLHMADLRLARTEAHRERYLRYLVQLAQGTGAGVVAVGVESADDHALAVGLGVDLLQGNLLAPPARLAGATRSPAPCRPRSSPC